MVKACPICGSRKWRRDNVTGSAVCEDGHVYQDFRVENQDADGPSQYALQRRKIKSRSKGTKKDQGGKNEAYYIVDDAEYLRIQALQLLLRYQIQALRRLWDLPEVFEMIVRDLWTYQLAISVLPPPPEEHAAPSRSQTPILHQPQPQRLTQLSLQTGMDIDQDDEGDKSDSGSDEDGDGDDGSKSDKAEEEPEIDRELLEEMSHLSELSDKEQRYGNHQRRGRGGTKGKKDRKRRRLKVSDTLVVIALGLWMIRRGTLCVDIENIVNGNQIPYLDFAHATLLPTDMKKHMNRDVVLSLSPIRCPAPKYLFGLMRLFARRLQVDFGLTIPDINLPQISWRLVGGLGGTPVTHAQVLRLLDLVDINLNLVDTHLTIRKRRPRSSRRDSSRGRSRSRMTTAHVSDDEVGSGDDEDIISHQDEVYRRTNRYQDIVMPELAVVAGWVIIMKMAYGLDGGIRRVTSAADPAVGLPLGPAWTEELGKRIRKGSIATDRAKLEKHDFSAMQVEDMDWFLNNAEDVLLRDRDIPNGSDTQTFPLLPRPVLTPPLPPPTSWRHFHETTPLIPPTPTVLLPGTGLPPEPAEEIRTYDPKDPTGSYPPAYETVLTAAAAMVGVKVQDVVEVVSLIERRLEKVRKARRVSMSGRWGGGRPKSRSRNRTRLSARDFKVNEEELATDTEDDME